MFNLVCSTDLPLWISDALTLPFCASLRILFPRVPAGASPYMSPEDYTRVRRETTQREEQQLLTTILRTPDKFVHLLSIEARERLGQLAASPQYQHLTPLRQHDDDDDTVDVDSD